MKKIVLIACVSKKSDKKQKAELLYQSSLFKKELQYAKEVIRADKIFILSALHGLLNLSDEVEPYNLTLNDMAFAKRKAWAEEVLKSLREHTDIEKDEFVFLAGERYRQFLMPFLKNYSIPMQGLKIGMQLQWLTKELAKQNEK